MTETKDEINNKEAKIYEVGYLFAPELTEEAVLHEVSGLKTLITGSFGGTEISSEAPKTIDLAYEMEKRIGAKKERYNKAYFGWIKFELTEGDIKEIKTALEKNTKIIRFLIIKTVRENTMAIKKTFARGPEVADRKKTPESEGVPVPAMTEEELDKTIDELVID